MSLSSYADLQAQVANWLARGDLTQYIPDMITLFEAFAARKLRVDAMESTTSLTTSSGAVALPTDFLGMRRLTWLGTPNIELQYVAPQDYANGLTSYSGSPERYTIEDSTIKVVPANDTSSYQLIYYAKTPAISSSLNWLWTTYPDAYLFGTLTEANAFAKNIQGATAWKARRDEVFEEIRLAEFRRRPPGMMVRVQGVTP